MAFVTVNHVPAAGDAGRALEARFGARQRLVDTLPGFRSFEVLRPAADPFGHGELHGDEYLAATTWADRRAFDSWRTSAAQRPVRPSGGGPLAQADAGSWFSMHESIESAYSADWQARALAAPSPIAVMNVMAVAQEHQGAFEEAFGTRQGEVEEQPGFLCLEVLRTIAGTWEPPTDEGADETSGTTYVVLSRWESLGQQLAWTRSDAFRSAHGRRRLPDGAILRSGVRVAEIVLPSYGDGK